MSTPHPLVVSRRALVGGLGVVATAGLAACTSSGNDPVGSDGYKPGSAELKVQLSPEISGVLYPDGYVGPKAREIEKFGDQSTTFRVLARAIPELDYPKNGYAMWLESKTGVKVNYDVVPMGADGSAKINAMISSGDLPDAFMAGPVWMGGFSRSQLYVYGEQGLFRPLDKLIDENAPNLLEALKQNPGLREYFTAPNGSMYAFPAINQCYHCQSASSRTWVNKHWLKKVGATKQPSTLDEMHALLTEFKKAYPDGQPYSASKERPPTALILNAFLNTGGDWLVRTPNGPAYTPLDPRFREAMKVLYRWSKEGLVDKQAFSQTPDQFRRLTEAPGGSKVGLAVGYSLGDLVNNFKLDDKNSRVYDFEVQQPVKGPDGTCVVPWNHVNGGQVGFVISKDCKNPETMIRWADAQFGLYATLAMTWGVPDKGWAWAKKGELGISGKQGIYKNLPNDEKNQTWWEQGPFNKMMDVRHAQVVESTLSQEPILYTAGKLYEPFASKAEEFFDIPFFDADQSAQYSEMSPNLLAALEQGMAKVGAGQLDPNKDGDWKGFTGPLEQANVKGFLELLKKADEKTIK